LRGASPIPREFLSEKTGEDLINEKSWDIRPVEVAFV